MQDLARAYTEESERERGETTKRKVCRCVEYFAFGLMLCCVIEDHS